MSRRGRAFAVLLAVAVSTVAADVPAEAQSPARTVERTLGGHRFLASEAIDDPFIQTMVRTKTGAGIASRVSRHIDHPALDSILATLVGDVAFMVLDFEYEHAVTDWLSLGLTVGAAARLGTGAQSILAEGVTSSFQSRIRATGRLFRSERWMVSASVQYSPLQQYRLSILDFAERVLEEGEVTEDNSLLRKSSGTAASLGLRVAYAPTPWLGFIVADDGGYVDVVDGGTGKSAASSGGAEVSFDMNPLWGVPLGILATGRYDSFVLGSSDLAQNVKALGAGIAYTGRSDFALSLEVERQSVPLVDPSALLRSISALTGSFNLRYFF